MSEPVTAPAPERDAILSDLRDLAETRDRLVTELRKRIIGQDAVIELLLTALLSRGHGLFIGVPGLAKTLLISSLADTLGLNFNRVQFTPDLMPSDITGTDVLEVDQATGKRSFEFIQGPLFCHILLADEVNRTPPKTQAALLQAMQELEVTAGGRTHSLEPPFLVFATQNPIEQEGTYPLPEAQLDRFMFSIAVNYPTFEEELEIVTRTTGGPQATIERVLDRETLVRYQQAVLSIVVAPDVVKHAVSLVGATRPGEGRAPEAVERYVSWGAGPRASQHLILGAKARAALHGRAHASVEDVNTLAHAVLSHRVLVNFQGEAERVSASDIVDAVLAHVR